MPNFVTTKNQPKIGNKYISRFTMESVIQGLPYDKFELMEILDVGYLFNIRLRYDTTGELTIPYVIDEEFFNTNFIQIIE